MFINSLTMKTDETTIAIRNRELRIYEFVCLIYEFVV